MKENERFHELIDEIKSLPEPNYDKEFNKNKQNRMHENLIHYASSLNKKKKRSIRLKKLTAGIVGIVALGLLFLLVSPFYKNNQLDSNQTNASHLQDDTPMTKGNQNDNTKQNDHENKTTKEEVLYKNEEYGFSFSLPLSWEGYQIIKGSWEGESMGDQPKKNPVEKGSMLSIRHPKWTAKKKRQDIPIMIFTINQWNDLQNEKFHIGAAPFGPSKLGQNNKYVFALPARYNYAFIDGYKEVDNILKQHPLNTFDLQLNKEK